MDPESVRRLESALEKAIENEVVKMGLKKLPLLPSRFTFQMMARQRRRFTRLRSKMGIVGKNDLFVDRAPFPLLQLAT